MTALDADLEDADALRRADTRGVLRSAASAGAQVRAVASALADGVLASLDGIRPRAIVLVAGRGSARRAASIVAGTLAGVVDVPVVRADRTPTWTGSLDLVVVAGDDPGDPVLAQSIADAVRRGAETVVTVPDEGPVGAAGAGYALRLPPRVSVLDANRMTHHLAAILAVLAAAAGGKDSDIQGSERGLAQLADVLDGEALRGGPERAVFRNAAKTLAARVLAAGGTGTVLAGDRPGTVALAEHVASVLMSSAGVSASAVELVDVLAAPRDAGSEAKSIFYDPQFDEPAVGQPLRVFVLSAAADARETQVRMASLQDADLIIAGDEPALGLDSDEDLAGSWAGVPQVAAMAPAELDDRPAIMQIAVLAARWELAAAYLALGSQPAGQSDLER